MAVKNTGKNYEEIVRDIYQAIVDYDNPNFGYKKIEVQHDIILTGMSGTTHQIDVYWEFELAGLSYKTIVEVKDWKSKVQQDKIHGFNSVKQDIAGCSNAVFVSKNGFQKGAIEYARHYGITLCQIEPNEGNTFTIGIENITTHYIAGQIFVDEQWMEQDSRRKEFIESYKHDRIYEDTYLIHPLGCKKNLFAMFCEDAVPYYRSSNPKGHKVTKTLEGPWFFVTNNKEHPTIKITGYEFVCYNTFDYYCHTIRDMCDYMIKDVLHENKVLYYSKKYGTDSENNGGISTKRLVSLELSHHQWEASPENNCEVIQS